MVQQLPVALPIFSCKEMNEWMGSSWHNTERELIKQEQVTCWCVIMLHHNQRTLSIQQIGTKLAYSLLYQALFLVKTCFFCSASLLTWWWEEAWIFDRQQGWPVICHKTGNFGKRLRTLPVSAGTMGRFHPTSECWSSVLGPLVSGVLSHATGCIHTTGSCAACGRDLIKTRWTGSWSLCLSK